MHEEKAYGSDNDYDGGESDDEAPEKLGPKENAWKIIKLKMPDIPVGKKSSEPHSLGILAHRN